MTSGETVTVICAALVSLPATITAVAMFRQMGRKIDAVHFLVNSRVTELIAAIEGKAVAERETAHAAGLAEGRKEGGSEGAS